MLKRYFLNIKKRNFSTASIWIKGGSDMDIVGKKGINRKGKDVSHNKALSKGGSNKQGTRLESPSKNRSRNYQKKK